MVDIDTDSLSNKGAIIASKTERDKLKISADVDNPKGPFYIDTLTGKIVFDRTTLALTSTSFLPDQMSRNIGHELGHISSKDNKVADDQKIADYMADKVVDNLSDVKSIEPSQETIDRLRNNENLLIGPTAKIIAENIPLDRREYVKWGRVFRGGIKLVAGITRTAIGVGEVSAGLASSSVGVGVVVSGHGALQTGYGISDTVEGADDIRLGFMDVSEEEREAVRLSKKVFGEYDEALDFTVGMTTPAAQQMGNAFDTRQAMSDNKVQAKNPNTTIGNDKVKKLEQLKHNVNATKKHIKDTPYYNQELANGRQKSYFNDDIDIQDIENFYKNGINNAIVKDRNNSERVIIDARKPIGWVIDKSGNLQEVTKIQYHLGKKGYHAVPYLGEEIKKK